MSSSHSLFADQPGRRVLMSGNQAVARGALEAGLGFAASYPGSPTVQVLESLAEGASERGLRADWYVNEIVALEACAGASLAGLRSLAVFKPEGLLVALDFATALAYSGTPAGMVIFVGDDPGAHSSVKEIDCRPYVRAAELPLLEARTPQHAKDAVLEAFTLSENLKLPVVLRATTRICHASGDVLLGELPAAPPPPACDTDGRHMTFGFKHAELLAKLDQAAQLAEKSGLNEYFGPASASKLVVASGVSALYALEALEFLPESLGSEIGVMALGTVNPLPAELVAGHLAQAEQVFFLEENAPFLEESVMTPAASRGLSPVFMGKHSGHVPRHGELNPDMVREALTRAFVPVPADDGAGKNKSKDKEKDGGLPNRELSFCSGCPHRASFWSMRKALKKTDVQPMILGDIGCYTLGLMATGFYVLQTVHCMGAGVGMGIGLGSLQNREAGEGHPVVAVTGDSTLYHGCVPGLLDAKHRNADLLLVVLDNSVTAMTGGQPHPGSDRSAGGASACATPPETLLEGLGIPVRIQDPFELRQSRNVFGELLKETGLRALIFRSPCVLIPGTAVERSVELDADLCSRCGNCTAFGCPGLTLDGESGLPVPDPVLCSGCGVCVQLCPTKALVLTEGKD